MKKTLIITILFFPLLAFAQPKSAHKFLVHFTTLKNYNSRDVEHTTEKGQQPVTPFLKANNTNGFQAGIGYEYVIKRHFPINVNILYGQLKEDYQWNFTFDHFHPTHDLSNIRLDHNYKVTIPYVALALNAGYDYHPFKDDHIRLQAKVGLGYMRFLKKSKEWLVHTVYYNFPGSDTIFVNDYADTQIYNQSNSGVYYDLYLGIAYSVKSGFIKEYRIGLTFKHAFGFFKPDADNISDAYGMYYNSKGDVVGSDAYYNRFRNLGLTLAVVF